MAVIVNQMQDRRWWRELCLVDISPVPNVIQNFDHVWIEAQPTIAMDYPQIMQIINDRLTFREAAGLQAL